MWYVEVEQRCRARRHARTVDADDFSHVDRFPLIDVFDGE
jgi:hypothetical protein